MVKIRPCRQEELPLVLERGAETAQGQLARREWPGATAESVRSQLHQMYRTALQMPSSLVAVAEWPDEPSSRGLGGHLLLMRHPNHFTGEAELVVMDVYVHPDLRGRRIGQSLIRWAVEYGRALGCHGLVAQVALHNGASLRLFQSCGFEQERLVLGKRI